MTLLEPIPGKDRIELATVLGYTSIVKKGDLHVGDLVVYVEPDSYVPVDLTPFSFLTRDLVEIDGRSFARIKRMKMAGVVSEGLALPLSEFGLVEDELCMEGRDMTEGLGLRPYERRVRHHGAPGVQHSTFPTMFFPKTDEVRLKSCPSILDTLKDQLCMVSEKLDGMSMTLFRERANSNITLGPDDDARRGLRICSRNQELPLNGTSKYHQVVKERDLDLPPGFCVQGELVGPGCNGNPRGLYKLHFYVFTVFFQGLDGHWEELPLDSVAEWLRSMDFEVVPYTFRPGDTLTIAGLEQIATSLGKNREGIVLRPFVPMKVRGHRVSAKILNPEYAPNGNDQDARAN